MSDSDGTTSPSPIPISKRSRRANKPMMEKRRRARINSCLNQLKLLVVDTMKNDNLCHSKVEKADILEMTVKYLVDAHKNRLSADLASDPGAINKYRTGYTECVNEVSRYLGATNEVSPELHNQLLDHLSTRVNSSTPHANQGNYLPDHHTALPVHPLQINIPCATPIYCLPGNEAHKAGVMGSGGSTSSSAQPASVTPAVATFSQVPMSRPGTLMMKNMNIITAATPGESIGNSFNVNQMARPVLICQPQLLSFSSANNKPATSSSQSISTAHQSPASVKENIIKQEAECVWRPW